MSAGRRSPGRPATGTPVLVRIPEDTLAAIDAVGSNRAATIRAVLESAVQSPTQTDCADGYRVSTARLIGARGAHYETVAYHPVTRLTPGGSELGDSDDGSHVTRSEMQAQAFHAVLVELHGGPAGDEGAVRP